MITLALLTAFCQEGARTSDDEALRAHIRSYAKTRDLDAKAAILKAGTAAIRTLYDERASREAAFDDLTELLFTIRFREVPDARTRLWRDLLARTDKEIEPGAEFQLDELVTSLAHSVRERQSASDGPSFVIEETPEPRLPCFFDPQVVRNPAALKLSYAPNYVSGKAYVELDRALARHGLDWAYRYGVILISTAARLWPAVAAPRALTAADLVALKGHIADLESADLERRTHAAAAIPAFGPAAVPLLKEVGGSEEARNRAVDIIRKIDAVYGSFAFDTLCAMDRQTLDGADKAVADRVNAADKLLPEDSWHTEQRIDSVLSTLGRAGGVAVDCAALVADLKISLDAGGISLRDALLLITRTYGLDFSVREGKVFVEPGKK
jgi:hypothetical protein